MRLEGAISRSSAQGSFESSGGGGPMSLVGTIGVMGTGGKSDGGTGNPGGGTKIGEET